MNCWMPGCPNHFQLPEWEKGYSKMFGMSNGVTSETKGSSDLTRKFNWTNSLEERVWWNDGEIRSSRKLHDYHRLDVLEYADLKNFLSTSLLYPFVNKPLQWESPSKEQHDTNVSIEVRWWSPTRNKTFQLMKTLSSWMVDPDLDCLQLGLDGTWPRRWKMFVLTQNSLSINSWDV